MELTNTIRKPKVYSSITFTQKEMVKALVAYATDRGFNFPLGLEHYGFSCQDHGPSSRSGGITYHLGCNTEGTVAPIIKSEGS